jgi:hypothetical protein
MGDICSGADLSLVPKIKNKYKMTDFAVRKTNILKKYSYDDLRTVTDEHYQEAYEIFKYNKLLFGKKTLPHTPEVRLNTLSQVARYLYIAAGNGLTEEEILQELKKSITH